MAGLNINNSLTGSGNVSLAGSGDLTYDFRSTNNTFSGNISVSAGGGYAGELRMNSLEDTVGRSINLGVGDAGGKFTYGTGAVVPLVLSNRAIVIWGTTGQKTFNNNATNANANVTIITDLVVGNTGNKTFTLGGTHTGSNTFAGAITNGTGSVISLTKANAGKWILTGTNTYTGTTTIADGTLEFASSGTYAGNISVTDTTPTPLTFSGSYTQTVGGAISGSMQLIKDGTGTLVLTGANTYTGTMTVNAGILSLGNGTCSSSLPDFSTLSVTNGAKVNLNYTGSDKVFFLNLGGSPAAAGTWGATGSGASNISDVYFTGTGVIENLAGNTASLNIGYWDGGSDDILGDGNAASAGGAGTWDTTLLNWDYGYTAHAAWANTTNDKAVFAGSESLSRTVTVTEATLNIKELSFETTGASGTKYTINGGTLNFGPGGVIRTADNRYDQTIASAITGGPEVRTKDKGGNTYLGLKFAPTNGTQTLGAVLNPENTGDQDKAGVTFAGTTAGNTVASIDYAGGDRYADTIVQSGEWTVNGGIRTGNLKLYGGKLIVGGTVVCDYNAFSFTNGILAGTAIVNEPVTVPASGTLAPGNPTGTLTVTNNNCTINGTLGITVNGSSVSRLAVDPTKTLTISSATLDVNVAATPSAPFVIATYGSGKLVGSAFAVTNGLPTGWTIDYASTAITLIPAPSGTMIIIK